MQPKGILFDLDDTIVADDIVSEQAWRKTCEIVANKIKPITPEQLYLTLNRERISFWSDTAKAKKFSTNVFGSRLNIAQTALLKLEIKNETIA